MKIFLVLLEISVNSPFYPHWLSKKKAKKARNNILSGLKGKVLEVGAGDGSRKERYLEKFKKIKKYVATDHFSWDEEFERMDQKVALLGKFSQVALGFKKRRQLDKICDAMNLPFKNNFFDYHLSFDVLEHVSDPFLFISEAARVIKKGGRIYIAVPVMYLIHGGKPDHKNDFFRYMPGFFYHVAETNNLKLETLYSNTGLGTTLSEMVNGWLILKIREENIFIKIILLITSAVVFPIINVLGFLLDIKADGRFANKFHVVLRKK